MSSRPNPIFGVLRLAVVVAAGAAGWFGYDMYVEQNDEAEALATAEAEALAIEAVPWPSDLGAGDVRWTGDYRVTTSIGDQTVVVSDHDGVTGLVRSTATPNGEASTSWVESDGYNAWTKLASDPVWSQVVDPVASWNTIDEAYEYSALTLRTIVPPSAWPYVVFNGESADALGNRMLSFRIKSVAFHAEQPAAAVQWRTTSEFSTVDQPLDLTVIVDALGRVIAVETSSGSVRVDISELPVPPVFESPLGS